VPTETAGQPAEPVRAGIHSPDVVRYGPGVPVTPRGGRVELTAQHAWHPPAGRTRRLRYAYRLLGSVLTVMLLAASGVLLYQRFQHTPLRVTGVDIAQQTPAACAVNVTGQITTNGAAGTVWYQWLFQPGVQPPQPLSQSVTPGQHALYVTTVIDSSGQGSATQTVTLQVLSPVPMTASTTVLARCR
jgi:hypothetical protein